MKIDMYNGDHATDADKIRIFFNDSTEINLYFPQFTINYD